MTDRIEKIYRKIFKFLRNSHNFQPANVMLDFERASRKAAASVWPHATIRGCFFHYKQSIRRKTKKIEILAQTLQTSSKARQVVQMFQNLPLLPLEKIPNGLKAIYGHQREHNLEEKFVEFNTYFDSYWMKTVGAEGFCVSDLNHRTNNFTEAYNSKVKRSIFRNPSLYVFLRELQYLMLEEFNRLVYDQTHRVKLKNRSKINTPFLFALAQLEERKMNEKQFLLHMAAVK
jgi:MULE transposase domain